MKTRIYSVNEKKMLHYYAMLKTRSQNFGLGFGFEILAFAAALRYSLGLEIHCHVMTELGEVKLL